MLFLLDLLGEQIKMKANDLALFLLLVFYGLVLGGIFIGMLWFLIGFIIELVNNGLWIALPIAVILMARGALVALASQSK